MLIHIVIFTNIETGGLVRWTLSGWFNKMIAI
jgi:hypothetical protein